MAPDHTVTFRRTGPSWGQTAQGCSGRGCGGRGCGGGGAAMPSEVLGGDLLPALRDTLLSKLVEPET